MHKTRRAVLIGVCLLAILCYLPAEAAKEPAVSARSAVLMDRESRRVLWKKNLHRRRPIASTTKIMTALLALEMGNEAGRVVAGPAAAETEGSSIWLEKGEVKTLGELLYGLMLCSGNDAAVAIAEHIGGSEKKFVALMNERAQSLGAKNTHFANPHGLPDDNHYSTAHDLGLITCAALEKRRFREIITTPVCSISWPGQTWDRILANQNKLLETYPGGDGVKTGWTEKAGRCFVGSATRKGWQLVCVVLNAPGMWEDTAVLLDYGFKRYRRHKILAPHRILCTAEVAGGRRRVDLALDEALYYPLRPGEKETLRYRIVLQNKIKAPIKEGDKLGEVEFYLGNRFLGRVDLCANQAVQRKEYSDYLRRVVILLLQEGW